MLLQYAPLMLIYYLFFMVLIFLPKVSCKGFDRVFFSCKGEYTATKNFIDGLYLGFTQAGIQILGEDSEIPVGESTGFAIQRAISESKLSVVVLSTEHAASKRCLDELLMIMERRVTDGYLVIPVFYDVDPADVRELTGAYGKAFAEQEKMSEEEVDIVEGWKRALKDIADVKGLPLNNRSQPQFIQHIVKVTEKKLKRHVLDVVPYSLFLLDSLRWIIVAPYSLFLLDSFRWIILLAYLPEIKKATYALATWVIKAIKAGWSWMQMHYQHFMN